MSIVTKDDYKLIMETGSIYCDSRELAKKFNKSHKNVLQSIEKEISVFLKAEKLALKIPEYFIEDTYTSPKKNVQYKRYKLTMKGFQQVALGFSGEKASIHRIMFIEFYEELIQSVEKDKVLKVMNNQNDMWKKIRQESMLIRQELTDSIKTNIVDYRNDVENKMNDGKYYMNLTKMVYKSLDIVLPKGVNPRDCFDIRQLVKIEDRELLVAEKLNEYCKKMHYKEAYKAIKADLGV